MEQGVFEVRLQQLMGNIACLNERQHDELLADLDEAEPGELRIYVMMGADVYGKMDDLLMAGNTEQQVEVWKSVLNNIKDGKVQYVKERVDRIIQRRIAFVTRPAK
jgi:hypothetical protein